MNQILRPVYRLIIVLLYPIMGSAQEKTIAVNDTFNSVVIYKNIVVYIAQGENNEIVFKNEIAANDINFEVIHGVLVIHGKNNFFSHKPPDIITIKVKTICAITIIDDAEVSTIGQLCNRDLNLKMLGDGTLYVNTSANEVTTFIKGLGKIEVVGNFKNTLVNKDDYGNIFTTYN